MTTQSTDELVKRLAETKGHTPGPWVVDECRVGNGIYIRQAFPKYTGTSVARTLSDGSPLPLPDAEANARLMALAPEMKDTIERLQRDLAARDKTIEALREDAERRSIRLTGYQIKHIWDFIDSENDADITIGYGPEFTDEEGFTPAGLRAWFTEYPEEGSIHLYETPDECQAAIDAARNDAARSEGGKPK